MRRGGRALVLTNQLTADQSAVWEAADGSSGWEVHLAGPPPRSHIDAFTPTATRPQLRHVHELRVRDLSGGRYFFTDTLPGLGALVRDVRPDVVHVNAEPWGLVVAQALRHAEVVVVHGCETSYAWGGLPRRALRAALVRANLRRLAGFASWNEVGVRLALHYGLPVDVPTAVLPAITAGPSTEPAAPPPPPGPLVVGFVARLLPEKGLDVLLEACALLHADGVDLELVVVGEGATGWLLDQALPFRVDRRGLLPNDAVRRAMRQWSVLAVPSLSSDHWEEQFGRVVVEAFAEGLPVVTSSSGALPEVVADAGVVVPERDARALADALARFCDPVVRHDLGTAGRARWEANYAPSVVAHGLGELWDRVRRRRT